jgi:hypothetical protein
LSPAKRLVLESRDQQPCYPFVHLRGESRVGLHRQPKILLIAPNMVGQPHGHRRRTPGAPLAQALVWHHNVVEADQPPAASSMTGGSPRHTAGAAPQGRPQPPQGALPACHQGGLDRLAPLAQPPLLANTAWATADPAPADRDDGARLGSHCHPVCVAQVVRCPHARCGLAPHVPTTPAPLHHAPHLEPCGGVSLPAVRQDERQRLHTRPHRCHGSNCATGASGRLLRALKVPSRSEHSRWHRVPRTRSMCLALPVQERCARVPVPERLHWAQGGCGHEHRVYLSDAGVVRVIAVLLWEGMDQKIQSRCQVCHVTVLQDYRKMFV